LELRATATDEWKEGGKTGEVSEAVEELVLRPEYERGAQDYGVWEFLQNCLFAGGLGARVIGSCSPPHAQCGDVHQRGRTGFTGSDSDGSSACDVHGFEGLRPRLGQEADQIYHSLGACDGPLHRFGIPQIGLHGLDLAHCPHGLQTPGKFGSAHRGTYAPTLAREGLHRVPADEP
jgi:hypothetical protein